MHIKLPGFLRIYSIRKFSEIYKININEAEFPIEHYQSIGDFFIRRLKLKSRPINNTEVVQPVDSSLTQIGEIHDGKLIQAKNKTYTVTDFLQDDQAFKKFESGIFATYYLCPTDYHRVHSPVEGRITSITHIPGKLWPVNISSVKKIKNLFAINERIVVSIQTKRGEVSLVFVGATNVGKIELSFDATMVSNDLKLNFKNRTIRKVSYDQGIFIEKGQELGFFRMGSTVVMLYSKEYQEIIGLHKCARFCGCKVKVGEALS